MDFKYIYGPVPSWRLGSSLGVDLLSERFKICTFDCIYCQINEPTNFTLKRKVYVSTEELMEEIKQVPQVHIDYITFSGRGEPTLAKNLGEAISEVKKIRPEPIAVLTNSSLIDRKDVREELSLADLVCFKIDASCVNIFNEINRPERGISFERILEGIKEFKGQYKGKLALQVMFVGANKLEAENIAKIAFQIKPDEVQINTPLRECGVKPLSREDMLRIKEYFKGLNTVTVYDAPHKKIKPISTKDTLKRRGKE